MRSFQFFAATSLAAVALVASSSAFAAEAEAEAEAAAAAADSGEGGLEVIVVTAQKRTENLQETPIAISVLGSNDLENRHVTSLVDLGDGSVPSLRVAPFFSRTSALVMNVRGIGVLSDSNQPARDQGVGVYVDGVYLGRAQGLGTAIYDVESIEVLKGPQGTLFGRNTEGGAVSIVTRKPTGKFGLRATAGVGNYGSYKGEVHLDLPRVAGFAVKLDGLLASRGGTVDNPLSGQSDFNSYDKRGIHAEVEFKPDGSAFSATYSFDKAYDASTPLYVQSIAAGSLGRAPIMPLQSERASVATIGVPQQPSVGKTSGHRLVLEWEAAPELTVKSISSYRKLDQSQYDNGAAALSVYAPSGSFARYSVAQFKQDQQSQELQLIGEVPELKFVLGGLYYREHVEDSAQAFNTLKFDATGTGYTVLGIDYPSQRIDRASRITTHSYGVFGQATWSPGFAADALHLTLGARWSRDHKQGELFTVNGATPNVDGVVGPRKLDAAWSRVDPLVNLAFDASDNVHFYGKWSTGYKSGGANSRSLRYAAFNPETVSMFELGAKTEFLDNRVRLNLAAYTGSYKNMQIDFSANFIQRDANGNLVLTNRTTTETTNAPGNGRLKGFEADLTLAPVDGLTLTASYAYNSVSIPDTVNPFPQGASGVLVTTPIKIYPVYTPKNSASFGLDYALPLEGAELRFHLDANYADGFYANYNDPAPGIAQPLGDSSFVVNGRIALADIAVGDSGATVTVSAWARNLLGESHEFMRSYSTLLGEYGIFNEPRTFGIELGFKL